MMLFSAENRRYMMFLQNDFVTNEPRSFIINISDLVSMKCVELLLNVVSKWVLILL